MRMLCDAFVTNEKKPHAAGFRHTPHVIQAHMNYRLWGLAAPALVRELVANVAMAIPPIRRRRLQGLRTGQSHTGREVDKLVAEFDFLLDSAGSIRGKTVVEIGPGDAIGLAPLFIAAGAARYVAIDRFLGDIWGTRAEALYAAIAQRRGPFAPDWRERVSLLSHSIEQLPPMVPIADVIVSFDVVEHLADVPRAVGKMAAVLKPQGRMVHRVDYGPHGIWVSTSDPLSFLKVPNWLWAAIGSNRGYPNRVRHAQLVDALRQENLQVAERITRRHAGDVLDAELVCGFEGAGRLGRPFKLAGTDTDSVCVG
jgi:SAM-dependent methyltransferase